MKTYTIHRRQMLTRTAAGAGGLALAPWAHAWGAKKPKTPPPALDDADLGCAGPLVGHTTATTSSVWMYAPAGATVDVRFAPRSAPQQRRTAKLEKIAANELQLRGQPWKGTLANLAPDTRYEFEVAVDGQVAPEHRGMFTTPPAPGAATRFRLGLTSCMKITQPQDSWSLFQNDKPTLHLTLGDTVYADTTDSRVQWRYHLQYRRSPLFAGVMRSMPNYAIWDDHDYGPDNSHGGQQGKEVSLAGWQRIWTNPASGAAGVPGAFYQFAWGDVDFFVVDGRYHRSPPKAKDDQHKTMLGEPQFRWLVERMKASQARFKVIATGSTLDHSQNDGWRVYTHARHQLFDAIRDHQLSGVVVMTGSLHRALAWEHHESDRVGYPLVEVISSGIANSKTRSYATIDFDTTAEDPTMAVRIVRGTGKVIQQTCWKLSQLSHA